MTLNDLYRAISDARSQRRDVIEFRMAQDTRNHLMREFRAPEAMEFHSLPITAFSVPIVVDPRVPPNVIVPIYEPTSLFGSNLPIVPRVVTSADESHGMTIDELLGEIDDVLDQHRRES